MSNIVDNNSQIKNVELSFKKRESSTKLSVETINSLQNSWMFNRGREFLTEIVNSRAKLDVSTVLWYS